MHITQTKFAVLEAPSADRKTRIGLMGEFSAGKSTLSNLLVGGNALPVQVTATQLPPVWISQGNHAPFMVDVNDEVHKVNPSDLSDIDVHETKYIRFFRDADLLELCDLVDMPGISDPNMESEVWERVLPHVDMVIWCTHATQAWRQSEAAVWSMVPQELKEKSILLLTRMDKILTERDRLRIIHRVRKEAGSEFREIFPVSLLQAIEAGDDREKWERSGAEALTLYLVDAMLNWQGDAGRTRLQKAASKPPAEAGSGVQIRKGPAPARVVPRRVRAVEIGEEEGGSAPTGAGAAPRRGPEGPLVLQ